MDRQEMFEAGREMWCDQFMEEHDREPTDEEVESLQQEIYELSEACYDLDETGP